MSIDILFSDIKIGISVAFATWSSGLATFLEWIPIGMGKLATVIGILLSMALIYTHLRKTIRDDEKHEVEMKLLNKQLEKQLEE